LPYRVRITDAALADARDYVRFVRDVKKEPGAAERWYRGLLEAVFSLEELPSRCPLIPEATQFTNELRHLIYHSHRIIFLSDPAETTVDVLRIYHGSRKRLSSADVTPEPREE
jgi:plasmid stabilization system protein ParE